MRLTIVKLFCLLLMLFGLCIPVAAEGFVGIVKSVQGNAVIKRNGETITVEAGMEIQQADRVKTDGQGTLGLVFSDDTRISMGPNTEIAVTEYLFEPKEKKLSLIVRLIGGTVSFLSGQMAKLSPKSVQLLMPAATIGVRGTHLLMKVD